MGMVAEMSCLTKWLGKNCLAFWTRC